MSKVDTEAATDTAIIFMAAGQETRGLGCTMKLQKWAEKRKAFLPNQMLKSN